MNTQTYLFHKSDTNALDYSTHKSDPFRSDRTVFAWSRSRTVDRSIATAGMRSRADRGLRSAIAAPAHTTSTCHRRPNVWWPGTASRFAALSAFWWAQRTADADSVAHARSARRLDGNDLCLCWCCNHYHWCRHSYCRRKDICRSIVFGLGSWKSHTHKRQKKREINGLQI